MLLSFIVICSACQGDKFMSRSNHQADFDCAEEYVDDDGVESGLVIQCRTGYAGVPSRVCAGVGSECRAEVYPRAGRLKK